SVAYDNKRYGAGKRKGHEKPQNRGPYRNESDQFCGREVAQGNAKVKDKKVTQGEQTPEANQSRNRGLSSFYVPPDWLASLPAALGPVECATRPASCHAMPTTS